MGEGLLVASLAGLAVGIAFIILFASFMNNNGESFSPQPYDKRPSNWIKLTKELDEMKAFLEQYPSAKTIVYTNTRIVEYYIDGNTSKQADLRIQIGLDNSIAFAQVMCFMTDMTTGEIITNSESTYHEQHGQRIDDMAEFLEDARCPS